MTEAEATYSENRQVRVLKTEVRTLRHRLLADYQAGGLPGGADGLQHCNRAVVRNDGALPVIAQRFEGLGDERE
jgi:hypothetical protein